MDFLKAFRMLIPEFIEKTDDEILIMLEVLSPHLSKKKLGMFYNEAAAYLVAHHLVLKDMIAEGGPVSSSLTAGAILSEKEGDIARTYADSSAGNNDSSDTLDKTYYGKEFKRILKMKIFSACTRFG